MILKTLLLYQSGILRILNSLGTNGILKRVICHFRAKTVIFLHHLTIRALRTASR